MSESQYDYKEEIRRLMDTLSSERKEEEAAAPSRAEPSERKRVTRQSAPPAATSLSDLPLVLGDVSYEETAAQPSDRADDEIKLIIPTGDMTGGSHGGTRAAGERPSADANILFEHLFHAQTVDNETSRASKRQAGFFERQRIRQGDSGTKILGKALFWFASAVLVVAACFGVYVLGIQPLFAAQKDQQLANAYDSQQEGTVTEQDGRYPSGMLASFRGLYDINPHVFGYIQYYDTADSFLKINSPIVCGGDNDTYLNKGFDGKLNVDGALFADERCADGKSKLTVIYGKNAANGRMFAGLNTLVGSVNNARAASRFTYSTLYEKAEYRVFALVLTDKSASEKYYFDCTRTDFSTDGEFDTYIKDALARSIFDYGVSVTTSDDVVVLVTDASHSVAKIGNARIAVYARRVRDGESNPLIVKNDDVIMPLAWYRAQGRTPHEYYTATTTALTRGTTATTTTATAPTESTAAPTTTPSSDGAPSETTTTTTTTTTKTIPTAVGDDGVVEMG